MELTHFGIKRRSGRYAYGSGDRPYQSLPAHKRERLLNNIEKKIKQNKAVNNQKKPSGSPKEQTDTQKNAKAIAERQQIKKNARLLSDDEIVRNINRLRSEKMMKDLIDEDIAPARTKVKNAIKQISDQSVRTVGTELATGSLRYLIKTQLTGKNFSAVDLAETIWPKQKQKQANQQTSNP